MDKKNTSLGILATGDIGIDLMRNKTPKAQTNTFKNKKKLLLLGWDAADWKIIWPLIQQGKMPSLKKIIGNGVYANMNTMSPAYSPMLWTSVATGKTPDKHGILNFIEINKNNDIQPVSALSRKTRTVWNIFTSKKMHSNIIGWWPTYPVEPIHGVMISDKFQKTNIQNQSTFKNNIHPKNIKEEIEKYQINPKEITQEQILPFIPKAHLIDQEKDKSLNSFRKILAENLSIHAAATKVMRETDWDFMAVYYDAIDHFCHSFMKFYPPKLKRIPQNLFDIYNEVIEGAYRFQDMMLGRMMQLADKNTTIIIMSDHGYESGNSRILEQLNFNAAPALEHRQFGIFAATGPQIKKGKKIAGLNLFDIAPTILHHFNLPVGKDMDGKVIQEMYEIPKKINYIESWDLVKGDFGENKEECIDTIENQEQLQQLIDLGYIEPLGDNKAKALLKVKCTIKHNLARVYKGKKDYANAKNILLELIQEDVDTVPFYLDLLSIALTKEDYKNAEKFLKKLRTLEKKFNYTTTIAEAKIALGKNKIKKALTLLKVAQNKKPSAPIWYELGVLYLRIEKYKEAKDALLNALAIENDNARFHQTLAVIYNRLEDYENAADHGFIAIELVKFFPEAHYALGEALQNLGQLEMAKAAFENAKRLKPKVHHKENYAIENINLQQANKKNTIFKNDEILIVSGIPRSGTSLMMQILNKAGLTPLTDNLRKPDISNPKGYFEYEPVKNLKKDNSWLHLAKGKTLKVVAPLLNFLDLKYRYKVIFMTRNLHEVIKSQQKMIGKKTDVIPVSLLNSYKKLALKVDVWQKKEPGIDLLYVDYNSLINEPEITLKKIAIFINPELDITKMKSIIDKSLYRNVNNSILND